ncbi:hypothetical protein MASR1M8_03150 [Thermomonas brevis]
MKAQLRALVDQGLSALRTAGTLPADLATPDFVIERPKERAHGDFSCNAAMLLARELGKSGTKANPRALAQQLLDALPATEAIARVEIAGPGFINFHLAPAAWQQQVRDIHAAGADFGRNASGAATVVGVEYVSANPTGPLHVGHGRAAAIGDCIARVLAANGWDVKREFYYNDAGVQIENLARSVQARARGLQARRRRLAGRRLQRRLHRRRGRQPTCAGTASRSTARSSPARTTPTTSTPSAASPWPRCAASRTPTSKRSASPSTPGTWSRRCTPTARWRKPSDELVAKGHTYEDGGALWLRSTDFGDDKDRVMRKSDGSLHLLRAGRGLPPEQVAARLPARDHRAGRRPPRLAGAGEGRPAGAGLRHPGRLSRTTCCTRWSR